jgi:hypothetical protein
MLARQKLIIAISSALFGVGSAIAADAEITNFPLREAYYGDLHLHTNYSFDAYVLFGAKVAPDEAYRFARGEAVDYLGEKVKRQEPLDFLAVTDHSENIGVFNTLDDPNSELSKSELGKTLSNDADRTKNFCNYSA